MQSSHFNKLPLDCCGVITNLLTYQELDIARGDPCLANYLSSEIAAVTRLLLYCSTIKYPLAPVVINTLIDEPLDISKEITEFSEELWPETVKEYCPWWLQRRFCDDNLVVDYQAALAYVEAQIAGKDPLHDADVFIELELDRFYDDSIMQLLHDIWNSEFISFMAEFTPIDDDIRFINMLFANNEYVLRALQLKSAKAYLASNACRSDTFIRKLLNMLNLDDSVIARRVRVMINLNINLHKISNNHIANTINLVPVWPLLFRYRRYKSNDAIIKLDGYIHTLICTNQADVIQRQFPSRVINRSLSIDMIVAADAVDVLILALSAYVQAMINTAIPAVYKYKAKRCRMVVVDYLKRHDIDIFDKSYDKEVIEYVMAEPFSNLATTHLLTRLQRINGDNIQAGISYYQYQADHFSMEQRQVICQAAIDAYQRTNNVYTTAILLKLYDETMTLIGDHYWLHARCYGVSCSLFSKIFPGYGGQHDNNYLLTVDDALSYVVIKSHTKPRLLCTLKSRGPMRYWSFDSPATVGTNMQTSPTMEVIEFLGGEIKDLPQYFHVEAERTYVIDLMNSRPCKMLLFQ